MTWRVGNKVPINVYKDDRPICQCHTPEDAAEIVNGMNRLEPAFRCSYCLRPGLTQAWQFCPWCGKLLRWP